MRKRPAEVHLDIRDLAVLHGKEFGVPESLAVVDLAFVSHERFVATHNNMLEVDRRHVGAVRPAALKIGLPLIRLSSGLVK